LRSRRRRLGLRLVGQMDHGRNRPLPSLVEWAGHGSECRGRAPARGVGRETLTRGFGARPRMSMQRDRPLPRIQPAHGWEGSRGRGRAPSSWGRARKPGRVSNRRRVGRGRRNRAGFLVVGCTGAEGPLLWWGAAGGRSAAPAKRVVQQHTACPKRFPPRTMPKVLGTCRIRVQFFCRVGLNNFAEYLHKEIAAGFLGFTRR